MKRAVRGRKGASLTSTVLGKKKGREWREAFNRLGERCQNRTLGRKTFQEGEDELILGSRGSRRTPPL